MKTTGGTDEMKRRAGERAVEDVLDGQVVGLGTGSTAAHAIRELGDRVDAGLQISCIPTSFQSRELAVEADIPLVDLDLATPDIAIDGADQIADGHLVKGGGGAHTREKYVDASADELVIVADPSKLADVLDHPIPVEVLSEAHAVVADRIEDLGGEPTLRSAAHKDGPVVTDNGNLVLDCAFGTIDDPHGLATQLSTIPGAVEHGLFVDLADRVYVGTEDGVDTIDY